MVNQQTSSGMVDNCHHHNIVHVVWSLGISLLELACEMELPSGGHAWHQLRSGYLPEEFTSRKEWSVCYILCCMLYNWVINTLPLFTLVNRDGMILWYINALWYILFQCMYRYCINALIFQCIIVVYRSIKGFLYWIKFLYEKNPCTVW